MTLILPDSVRATILEHARRGRPREVVGVLAGDRAEDVSVVERRYEASNAAERPRVRYEIAPEAEIEILERIDRDGLDVVGFYHSHPRGPLEPSDVDAERAAWPGYSYVIAVPPDRLGSWRWDGERFEREPIRSSD